MVKHNLSALSSYVPQKGWGELEELRIKYGFKYFLSLEKTNSNNVFSIRKSKYLVLVKQSIAGSGLQ